jgi:hypothetical protein
MNSSVTLAPNIFISTFSDKSSYCPPENITITTNVENRGNLGVVGNLATRIFDPNNVEFMNGSWLNINLSPGDKKNFYLNHTVTESDIAGIYEIVSNLTYSSTYKTAKGNFRIKQGIGSLVASPPYIEETAMPGDLIVREIYFWLIYACYGTYVYLNTTPGPPGDWIIFSVNPIWLSPIEWNLTKVYIYIDLPKNTPPADYKGYIYGWAEEQRVVIPVTIHVQPTPIFDLKVEVPPEKKEVCLGDDVYAKITITKIFPPETLDVNMTYRIEMNKTIYDEKKETIAITTTVEKFVTLKVPSNAPEGIYTFSATLQYENTSVYAYDVFTAKYCPPPPPPPPAPPPPPPPIPLPQLILNVSTRRVHSLIGGFTSFLAWITNIGDAPAFKIKLHIEGIPSYWINLNPVFTDILPKKKEEFLVLIKVPVDAKEGAYQLRVKGTDTWQTNEEIVFLTVAKDWESLAKILYEQVNATRERALKIKFLTCLDIKNIIVELTSTEEVRNVAIKEFSNKNWKKAIELFEYVSSKYEDILAKVNVLMDVEFTKLKPFSFPPFTEKINERLKDLSTSLRERDYEIFCENLVEIQKLSTYSKFSLISIILVIVISVLIIFFAYRRKVEIEPFRRLKKIRERLKIKS